MIPSDLTAKLLACGRLLAVASVAALLSAAAPDNDDPSQPLPGFLVVPDLSDAQSSIAFVSSEPPSPAPIQRPGRKQGSGIGRASVVPRVAEPPAPLAAVSLGAATTHTLPAASLPPPMIVRVSFPAGTAGARAQADRVVSMLRARGVRAELRGADRGPASRARIVFAFAEDRPAAEAVDRTLRAAYGLGTPITLDGDADPSGRPGLIEVALPG
jgi:hypothetical protein